MLQTVNFGDFNRRGVLQILDFWYFNRRGLLQIVGFTGYFLSPWYFRLGMLQIVTNGILIDEICYKIVFTVTCNINEA